MSEDPPAPAPEPTADAAAVWAVVRRYYEAFEQRDLDAMSELWEHSDRVVCTHPGWRTLHGWGAVGASWFAIFGGPQQLQVILTNERVQVVGDVAWATVDENLLDAEGSSGTIAALNVLVRHEGTWRFVAHHGSPVAPQLGPTVE